MKNSERTIKKSIFHFSLFIFNLIRESQAMGLDQDDPQVRRRMRMKLEFILEDLSSQDVTDEVLTAYLKL